MIIFIKKEVINMIKLSSSEEISFKSGQENFTFFLWRTCKHYFEYPIISDAVIFWKT